MSAAKRAGALAVVAAASLGAAGTCSSATSAPSGVSVTARTLLVSERVSRTEFDYVYEVTLTNAGGPVKDVHAVVTTSAPGTTVIDGDVLVAAIAGRDTVVASDTIRLRQDRTYPFNPAALVWSVSDTSANGAPVAAPGAAQSAFVGSLVQLDGSASSDPDGNALSYAWTISSAPPGSLAALDFPSSPQPAFEPDAPGQYELTLVVSDGFLSSPAAATFVTASAVDPNAPAIVSVFPAPFSSFATPSSSVVIEFSEDIDPATVTSPTNQVRLAGPQGFVDCQIRVNGRSVILQPDVPLDLNSTYTVMVTAGRIADFQGQTLADYFESDFNTGPPGDGTPPQVIATAPASGATGIVPTRPGTIAVDFSEPVDPGSVAASFQVFRVKGAQVPGSVAMAGPMRAVFTPANATPQSYEGQDWIASVGTGLRDLAGNTLPQAVAWTFRNLPTHAPAWLSKMGVGSAGETDAYYASAGIPTGCTPINYNGTPGSGGFQCTGSGTPATFTEWLDSLGWFPTTHEVRATFYNGHDLAMGRDVRCFSTAGGAAGGTHACYVLNHGPIPGSPGHPDPPGALASAVAGASPKSISAMFFRGPSHPAPTLSTIREASGYAFVSAALRPGDFVTIDSQSGTIAPGNLFWATSGPAGVGAACFSNLVDPQPCPLEGGPLYGLLADTPAVRLTSGAARSGIWAVGASPVTFKVLAPGSLKLRINDTYPGNGSGEYAARVTVTHANALTFAVYVPDGSGAYRLARTSNFDAEGPKQVPQACISCHGGTWDAETATVTGAVMLPIVPSQVTFPTTPGRTMSDQLGDFSYINYAFVSDTDWDRHNPTRPLADWITGIGSQTGQPPDESYTPPGWAGDAALYHGVVRPYCQSCHFALRPGLTFESSASFRGFATSIRGDVCAARSMPHAGPTFEKFWQSNAAALLSQALFGGASCP